MPTSPIEVCWNAQKNQIREPERSTAKAAYDEAAKIYEQRLKEAVLEISCFDFSGR